MSLTGTEMSAAAAVNHDSTLLRALLSLRVRQQIVILSVSHLPDYACEDTESNILHCPIGAALIVTTDIHAM